MGTTSLSSTAKRSKRSICDIVLQNRGRAADYIQQLPEDCRGLKFILVCRKSHHTQDSLETQATKLRAVVEARGGIVVRAFKRTVSGIITGVERPSWLRQADSIWLSKAARIAKKKKAILVAATTDRFVRHSWFWSTTAFRDAQATEHDLWILKQETLDVPLMTYLHPDASASECRALLSRWGQEVKGKKGGGDRLPGHRKRRKEKWLARVLELKQQGLNQVKIADGIFQESGERITAVTVGKWVKGQGL
jgi:hypothetical protein